MIPQKAEPLQILSTYERILLYGEGGTGKTFTAGTAPEPQWWLVPGGPNEVKTLFSRRFIEKHGRKEIYITSVTEDREKGQIADNPSGFDRCCDAVDAFLEWNDKHGAGVQTIIVDNATVLEEYMLNKAIAAEYVLSGSKDRAVLQTERKWGIRRPHDTTWGAAQSLMEKWINWLRELPFHLIFIAHEYRSWEQEEDRRLRVLRGVLPLFVGQQRTQIPNKFDNVWYALVMGGGHSQTWGIQTERDQIRLAKTRVGGILDPHYERDPNISEIIKRFSEYAQTTT